jgi:hypothetical protein
MLIPDTQNKIVQQILATAPSLTLLSSEKMYRVIPASSTEVQTKPPPEEANVFNATHTIHVQDEGYQVADRGHITCEHDRKW